MMLMIINVLKLTIIRVIDQTMDLRSLSHSRQKLCSPSRQQSANDSIVSLVIPSSSSMKVQRDSKSSSERVSISGPVQLLVPKMSSLLTLAASQFLAKLMLEISNPSVTMVLMIMVFSDPVLVTQMVISFISPWNSFSSLFCCPSLLLLFSSSSNWVGVLTLESSLTWYAPEVLESSTRVFSLLTVHPPFLNSFSQASRSFRFSDSVLISSSIMLWNLPAFWTLPKLNLGVARVKGVLAQRRTVGKIPLVIILEII